MTDKLVDRREPGFYIVDNEIIDVFGAKLGVYGIAVYNVLLKFANASGENAFPSYQTIANLLSISRPKAIEGVKLLLKYGLIEKTSRKSASGDPTTNVYTLLDAKKVAGGSKPHLPPSKQDLPGGGKQDLLGGKPRLPDQDPITNTQLDQDTSKRKKEAAPPHPMTDAIKDAYVRATGRKLPPSAYRTISPDAKFAAEQGITPQEIESAYGILKSEAFWKGKTIPLRVVLDKIDQTEMTIRNRKEEHDAQATNAERSGWTPEEIELIRKYRREGTPEKIRDLYLASQARLSKV